MHAGDHDASIASARVRASRPVSMTPFPSRSVALVLLVGLAAMVLWQGIIPALSRIDTDFPNYLTAAKIVAERGDTDRLYDDRWFQAQSVRYGMSPQAKFTPFPPPTALLLLPLAGLEPLTALRVLTLVSVACLILSAFFLARTLQWSVLESSVFMLLAGHAILNDLRFGQAYILVATACILGYYAYLKGRPWLAGICLGLFLPIKYYPVVLLAGLALRKEWKILLSAAITCLAVMLLSIGVLGWPVHETFLLSVLGNHLSAHMFTPMSATYQSFDTLLARLFVLDPIANPHPWFPSPALRQLGVPLTKLALMLMAAAAVVRLARADSASAVAPSIGILGILALLIAPGTATYHFVLLWLPVGLLVRDQWNRQAQLPAYLILAAYALIGFLPYKLTAYFEGRGAWTLLAYPRLGLLLVMFITAIYVVFAPTPARIRESTPR